MTHKLTLRLACSVNWSEVYWNYIPTYLYKVIWDVGIICIRGCVVCKWWREWKMDLLSYINKFLIGQWEWMLKISSYYIRSSSTSTYKLDLSCGLGMDHRMHTGLWVVWIEYHNNTATIYWQNLKLHKLLQWRKVVLQLTLHITLHYIQSWLRGHALLIMIGYRCNEVN